MENYEPNSHRFKEKQQEISEKKVEKMVKGNVKSKKKSEIQKFADNFISEDVANIKSYIISDALIPAIKKIISDVVDMILYGGTGGHKKNSSASKVSYRSYYDNKSNDRSVTRTYSGYNYDDIILDNRGEAEDVLMRMDELVATYQMVSVADLYDLVGITCNYTDNKYGWKDIRSASVVRVRDGYMIKLPKALPLD